MSSYHLGRLIDHIHLRVTDLEASKKFYRAVLTSIGMGHAFQEVAVALLDHPGSYRSLQRFVRLLATSTTTVLIVGALTPASRFWFETVSGLNPELVELARTGLWFGILLPSLSVLQNWFQGILVHSRFTRAVTEAVVVFLITCGTGLLVGVYLGRFAGLYVGLASFSLGGLAQMSWLWARSRKWVSKL